MALTGDLFRPESIFHLFWFSPGLLSEVLLQLDLAELSEISDVFHSQSLHDGLPQLPAQVTTEEHPHMHLQPILTVIRHYENIIVLVQVIYLHFPDGKSAEEFWNGPQRQNCLAIRLV